MSPGRKTATVKIDARPAIIDQYRILAADLRVHADAIDAMATEIELELEAEARAAQVQTN